LTSVLSTYQDDEVSTYPVDRLTFSKGVPYKRQNRNASKVSRPAKKEIILKPDDSDDEGNEELKENKNVTFTQISLPTQLDILTHQ
jgi:hypothetical protein